MREGLTAAVIAGGAGRRMGGDKRPVLVEGVPLLARAVAAVSRIANEVLVATTRTRPLPIELPNVRIVYDRVHDGGPLAGIEAALAGASHELVLVVAGDMPWLQEPLLRLLVDRARAEPEANAIGIVSARGMEPLLAVYRPAALPVVAGLVDRGEHRVGRVLELVRTVGIPEKEWRRVDPHALSLVNINRPNDVAG
jgi:molybdopterin-guanine dinucleotide biosynthesis protein A